MSTDIQSLMKIEVPVIVLIAQHTLNVDEVRHLSPGAILELPTTLKDELEIHVNNQPIAMGTAVKVGENFGVRVTFVGDLKQRIEALGRDIHDSGDSEGASEAETGSKESPSDSESGEVSQEDASALADEILANS